MSFNSIYTFMKRLFQMLLSDKMFNKILVWRPVNLNNLLDIVYKFHLYIFFFELKYFTKDS